MCFYHESDWYAQVYDDDHHHKVGSGGVVRCEECHQKIHPGEECRRVYMREHEQCDNCGANPEDAGPCLDEYGGDHRFGEEFECHVCDRCQQLLAAVQAVEQEAGCEGNEALPPFGELREAMWQSDHAAEYVEWAAREYPGLTASGHLDRFYALTREADEWAEQWDAGDLDPANDFDLWRDLGEAGA